MIQHRGVKLQRKLPSLRTLLRSVLGLGKLLSGASRFDGPVLLGLRKFFSRKILNVDVRFQPVSSFNSMESALPAEGALF